MSPLEDSARSDGGDAVAPATVSEKPERLRIVPTSFLEKKKRSRRLFNTRRGPK
jgi:hypothetical protein